MQLDWAILAESAQVRDGLAFVMAGGIDTLRVPELPARFTGALAVRMLLHRTEAGREHVVEVRVLDEDGRQLTGAHQHFRPDVPERLPVGWPVPLIGVFNFHLLELPREAQYTFEILGDGVHVKTLNLQVNVLSEALEPHW